MTRGISITIFILGLILAPLPARGVEPTLPIWSIDDPASMDSAYEVGLAAYGTKDFGRSLEIWKPLADTGHVRANHSIGILYVTGNGVVKDYKKALQYFLLSAREGYVESYYNVGYIYTIEDGFSDHERALGLSYLVKAAQSCEIEAMRMLSFIFNPMNNFLLSDLSLSRAWMSMAAQFNPFQYAIQATRSHFQPNSDHRNLQSTYYWFLVYKRYGDSLNMDREQMLEWSLKNLISINIEKSIVKKIEKKASEFLVTKCNSSVVGSVAAFHQTEVLVQRQFQKSSPAPAP